MCGLTGNVPLREEPIFVRMDGMRLHFDSELPSQREDPLEAARTLEGREREEEVEQAVAPGQDAAHDAPVDAVPRALLTRLEREVSAHEGSRW